MKNKQDTDLLYTYSGEWVPGHSEWWKGDKKSQGERIERAIEYIVKGLFIVLMGIVTVGLVIFWVAAFAD